MRKADRASNDIIQKLLSDIKTLVKDLERREIDPEIHVVKKEFEDLSEPKKKTYDFEKLFEEFLVSPTSSGKIRSVTSLKQYRSCLNNLKTYLKKQKIPLALESMSVNFYHNYVTYLSEKKEMLPNTVANQIKNLKSFLKWVEATKGYDFGFKLGEFKVSKELKEVVYLT